MGKSYIINDLHVIYKKVYGLMLFRYYHYVCY
jgi:hypothetical protein